VCSRNFDPQMAPILCIAAVDIEVEATLNFSRYIVREMALILCIVVVDMETEATLKFPRNIARKMFPILSVFAVNITTLQALTAVKIFSGEIGGSSSFLVQLCD